MTERNFPAEREALIRDLRKLVVNYSGPIEESPYYDQLARLLVNECIVDQKRYCK